MLVRPGRSLVSSDSCIFEAGLSGESSKGYYDWEDKDGNKRYTTEIVVEQMQMLGSRGSNHSAGQNAGSSSYRAPQESPNAPYPEPEEDDIPF